MNIDSALKEISNQAGFNFSYSKDVFDIKKKINLDVHLWTVRKVLSSILNKEVIYKERGNYIILQKKHTHNKMTIHGYISDKTTGEKIPNATVYDPNSLSSAVSDEYGFYSISVPEKSSHQLLSVNKNSYEDTCLIVFSSDTLLKDISIRSKSGFDLFLDSLKVQTDADRIKSTLEKKFSPFRARINQMNIQDSILRRSQISFLPYLGTNKAMSGNVINRYSLNIIGGYSLGNEVIEAGGVFNLNRMNVNGFQCAGVSNIVGGNMNGIQFSGISNIVIQNTFGLQGAGILNYNKGKFNGIQAAGIINLNRDTVNGIVLAGIININNLEQKSISASGIYNQSKMSMKGIQLAGVGNVADSGYVPVQVAGLFNYVTSGTGLIQAAGLFNYSKNISGFQIAPFNFSDSCSGIPVGLFSYVTKGLHQLEFSYDELYFSTISFRSGVKHWYTIITGGINSRGTKNPLWSIGYGMGSDFRLGKKLTLDLALTTSHLSRGDFYTRVNLLNRLYIGPEWNFFKSCTAGIGPLFTLFISDSKGQEYPFFSSLPPYTFYSFKGSQGTSLQGWIGAKAFIRFF